MLNTQRDLVNKFGTKGNSITPLNVRITTVAKTN